jgi:hypothetical protein
MESVGQTLTSYLGLDSGTGETKIILFTWKDGNVETKELAKTDSLAGLFSEVVADPNDGRNLQMENIVTTVLNLVEEHKPTHCFAGTTAWYRDAPQAEKDRVNKFLATRLPGFEVLNLAGDEEARYEGSAVEYAAEKSQIGTPDMQIAAGGGSMQLMQGQNIFGIAQGFRQGQGELMAGGEKLSVVIERLEKRIDETTTLFKASNPNFLIKNGMKVIGISASFYAAKGAKIDCSGPVKASDALAAFRAKKDVLISGIDIESASKVPKKEAQEIANLIIFSKVFETMVHPDASIFFKRDWVLDGVPFITTWSAGYVLSHKVQKEKEGSPFLMPPAPPPVAKKGAVEGNASST